MVLLGVPAAIVALKGIPPAEQASETRAKGIGVMGIGFAVLLLAVVFTVASYHFSDALGGKYFITIGLGVTGMIGIYSGLIMVVTGIDTQG